MRPIFVRKCRYILDQRGKPLFLGTIFWIKRLEDDGLFIFIHFFVPSSSMFVSKVQRLNNTCLCLTDNSRPLKIFFSRWTLELKHLNFWTRGTKTHSFDFIFMPTFLCEPHTILSCMHLTFLYTRHLNRYSLVRFHAGKK